MKMKIMSENMENEKWNEEKWICVKSNGIMKEIMKKMNNVNDNVIWMKERNENNNENNVKKKYNEIWINQKK